MRHSVHGYLAAIQFRGSSGRTVLVEGEDDKCIVARISEELKGSCSEKIYIDSADLIQAIPGLGNRDILVHVHAQAMGQALKFAALADREFRKFSFQPTIDDEQPIHNVEQTTFFWTRGHSIENYFFTLDRIKSFLRYRFSERLPNGWDVIVENNIGIILKWAAAYSIAALENSVIKRMRGIVKARYWISTGTQVELDTSQFLPLLASRSVPATTITIMETRIRTLVALLKAIPDSELAQWVTHGHLGEEMLWTGVAHLISTLAADARLIEDIATGYCEEKLRHAADGWAPRVAAKLHETPIALREWLTAITCVTP